VANEPGPSRKGNRLTFTVRLLGLVAAAGVLGLVLSLLQRPPAPAPFHPPSRPVLPPPFTASPTPAVHGPVSSYGFSVADDPATHRVVFFGGVDSYDQTWVWDGGRWSRLMPRTSPPGRFQAAAAYNPETRLVMLFGGRLAEGQLVNDTWAWSGSTWRELDNGAGGPPPGEGSLMVWDEATREMVLITPASGIDGGETWIWSGRHWSRQSGAPPPTPIAGEVAFDPASRAVILVSALSPPMGAGTTTWSFDGRGWHPLPATPPQATAGLALDPASRSLLLCSDPTADAFAQLWRWNGSAWALVPRSQLTVEQGIEVTDLDRAQFLMLGFEDPPTQLQPQPVHVWEWNGSSWHQRDATDTS
jgi:hypothetical protein